MPSRKQRRRQQKARRHEYEYVYVDDEGNQVEVDPAELRRAKGEGASDGKKDGKRDRSRRPTRVVHPPSWTRVGKRALIFAPIMFLFVSLLGRKGEELTLTERLLQTLILVAMFVPFGYFTETLAYRAYRRRVGDDAAPPKTR